MSAHRGAKQTSRRKEGVLCYIIRVIVAVPDAEAVAPLGRDVDKLPEDVDKLMEGKTT